MSALLNKLFLSHRRSLLGTVMRIVRDKHAAEELAQETYIRARKAVDAGPVEHLEAFLHQTARNLAIDHIRHRDMRSRFENNGATDVERNNVAADIPSPESEVISRERFRLLNEALSQLPERTQSVWVLSRVHKWSHKQIADHLGVSPNTVFNDLKKAMGHCHDALTRIDRD